MSKFTPGPWLRDERLVYTLQHYGWRKGVEEFENRFTAQVSGSPRGAKGEEVDANVVLIAAAPDLYEALWEAREFIENQQLLDAEWSRVLDVVVAALAKADGKPTQSPAPNQPASPREP